MLRPVLLEIGNKNQDISVYAASILTILFKKSVSCESSDCMKSTTVLEEHLKSASYLGKSLWVEEKRKKKL